MISFLHSKSSPSNRRDFRDPREFLKGAIRYFVLIEANKALHWMVQSDASLNGAIRCCNEWCNQMLQWMVQSDAAMNGAIRCCNGWCNQTRVGDIPSDFPEDDLVRILFFRWQQNMSWSIVWLASEIRLLDMSTVDCWVIVERIAGRGNLSDWSSDHNSNVVFSCIRN